MPLDQFSERLILKRWGSLTDTATPDLLIQIGFSFNYDGRVDVLNLFNNDSIAHNVTFYSDDASPDSPYGGVEVPAGAGYAGVPPVNFLAAILPTGLQFLYPLRADTWAWSVHEAINSGKFVSFMLQGGYF